MLKLCLLVAAILDGGSGHRTQFWKYTTQGSNKDSADSDLVVFAVPLYCGCAWLTPQVILISGWFIATICLFMNDVILMT